MQVEEIAQRLVAWHAGAQRDLPWRNAPAGHRDPYTVWVSEVMAQQTRVATVEQFYTRWMARYSTVHALASADLQEVLKLWEGLGYYARARNLHRAAGMVEEYHAGKLPRTRRELLALPGIGAHTAGAILSLAHGQREAILDGNVKRVLSRLNDMTANIDEGATVKTLWALARALVEAAPNGEAGAVNEGLMELGAVICTPASPHCPTCPLREFCIAAARGTQDRRPVRSRRAATPHYDVTAGVIWEGEPLESRLLIAQRPLNGMLGGLWEFPGGKLEPSDAGLQECLRREIAEELGITINVLEPVVTVRHAYTHFRITLHAFHASHVDGAPQALACEGWRWVTLEELPSIPFAVTDQKIIATLRQNRGEQRMADQP